MSAPAAVPAALATRQMIPPRRINEAKGLGGTPPTMLS
jgi:hypothetical protein